MDNLSNDETLEPLAQHDPLCPRLLFEEDKEFVDPEHYCACGLISVIRRDEQQKRPASLDWVEGYQQGAKDALASLSTAQQTD